MSIVSSNINDDNGVCMSKIKRKFKIKAINHVKEAKGQRRTLNLYKSTDWLVQFMSDSDDDPGAGVVLDSSPWLDP